MQFATFRSLFLIDLLLLAPVKSMLPPDIPFDELKRDVTLTNKNAAVGKTSFWFAIL
jgi:hypothetical protein